MIRFILVFLMLFLPGYALAIEIKSDAFDDGGMINSKYTCDAENISPPLEWKDVFSNTKSFVLICDDPDSPSKSWTHWVLFNIPADKTSLSEGVPKTGTFDDGMIQGINDFGKVGYDGPCPPPTGPHRYFFRLYAIDIALVLDENSTKDAVLDAIKGHIIGEAVTFGTYER